MKLIQTDLTGAKEKIKEAQLKILKRIDPRLQEIAKELISKKI
jgi:hypothetical protein